MAPKGSQELVETVGYQLQLRGLRVVPLEANAPERVLLVLADLPPAVESDPAGFAFVREVVNVIKGPSQNVVLLLAPSVRARYGLNSPWEEIVLSEVGLEVALKSALGESVTQRSERQTDLLIRPDWRSDAPVSASIGGLASASLLRWMWGLKEHVCNGCRRPGEAESRIGPRLMPRLKPKGPQTGLSD